MRLFPGVQLAFGPTTENGFYYDIDLPDRPISEDDFPRHRGRDGEDRQGRPSRSSGSSLPDAEARQFVDDLGQGYKVEHIDDELHKYRRPQLLPPGRVHRPVPRPAHPPRRQGRRVQAALASPGPTGRTTPSRKQLQRLYGTAFFDKKDLDAYLAQVEEAKKRDHRVLGKQLKLFTIRPLVGSGLILWMPKGAIVRGILENFIKDELLKRGYQPVYTPHIGRIELYQTSGHYPYYRDSQFPPIVS